MEEGSDKKRRHRLKRAEGRRKAAARSLSLALPIHPYLCPLSSCTHNTHVDLVHRTRLNAKSYERVTRRRGEKRGRFANAR